MSRLSKGRIRAGLGVPILRVGGRTLERPCDWANSLTDGYERT